MRVDFDFRQFDHNPHAAPRPLSLPILIVGVAARQAASVTAQVEQRRCNVASPVAQSHLGTGAFNAATARAIMKWKGE